jgi:hypothetical protein
MIGTTAVLCCVLVATTRAYDFWRDTVPEWDLLMVHFLMTFFGTRWVDVVSPPVA